MAREAFHFHPISLSPPLPVYHLGDAAMDSGHGELVKFFDWDPPPFFAFPRSLAVIDLEGKFEVSEGLFESADGLFDFDIHSHFFLDMIS